MTERHLLELAVHVKLASEAIEAAAQNLIELRPAPTEATAAVWSRTMDDLAMMNVELGFMEEIVRTAACGRKPAPAGEPRLPHRRAI